MATGFGFSKAITDGLIFGYDTGDKRNIFKGQPGTNIAYGPNRNYNGAGSNVYSNGKLVEWNGYTETVDIPTLGRRQVDSIDFYNVYSGYGVDGNFECCPSLFNYSPSGWNSTTWSPNTTYTYQIIYKTTSGYTHPNYMYHYEYASNGSYITEYGVHDTAKREHLGDGWYHAWNTFTTNASAATGYIGFWHYEYNTRNKVSVAAVSLVQGSTIRPPLQFIDEGSTRSNTQALLNMANTTTINVSSVSFNTSGDLVFDGTDDTLNTGIPLTNLPALSNFTMECVVKIDAYPTAASPNGYGNTTRAGVLLGAAYYSGVALYWYGNSSGTACTVYAYIRGNDGYRNTSGFNLIPGRFHHLLLVNSNSNSTLSLYADGNLISSAVTATQEYNASLAVDAGNIGISKAQVDGGGENVYSYLAASVPVVKIYNRALTPGEIRQNFNLYRTRFNL